MANFDVWRYCYAISIRIWIFPTGDQPEAIKQLVDGFDGQEKFMTLQGVTGSGKTFTVANVVKELQRPTLVLAHNKTLAAQLYSEFKQFFPNNAVEYFVSYYDYYQPEAYIPVTGTYIEKDLSINEEIEKLRLSTTSSSSQDDAMSWWSPRCRVYTGLETRRVPKNVITSSKTSDFRTKLLHRLVQSLYSRTTADFNHGNFRVKGDVVTSIPAMPIPLSGCTFWGWNWRNRSLWSDQ